ncbi:putative NADH dehydrogenase [Apostichopus japonicus]|uniref:NADH dehydrogenase [ubiquinone] 1 alpha subcomplex subunit 9, mitochondrial n=1 Tax=Stichopus japonicus TaxID=307972 RepID=A0A2G8JU10_STIJA|nr:putative NADH dehydrogenase [Apostichopus japonicus]
MCYQVMFHMRPLASLVTQSQSNRHASSYHEALVPKGTGGRSSFSGVVAAVFGATGFLGRYVVSRLGRDGSQVMIPYRCEPYNLNHFKVMGDLGQLLYRDFHIRDKDKMREIVSHCNVVINLVGQDYETRNFSFEDIHIELPRYMAKICKEENVERFIHLSALGADLGSKSKFLRTKAAGESVVLEEFPDAVIVRPSQMFGPEDRFFNHFANQRYFGGVPLFMDAGSVVKRPVFVVDVAKAVVSAVRDKELGGKKIELAGPNGYKLTELVDFLYRVTRRPYIRYPVPRPILKMIAGILKQSPFTPWMTPDMLELQHTTDVVDPNALQFEDLGIYPESIEESAIKVLRKHRADRFFDLSIDDIEPAPTVK